MLFFRKFIHLYLPVLLIGLGTLIYCLFSFAPTVNSIAQYSLLTRAKYEEMFYSATPYQNPDNGEKKDAFADFASVTILKAGKMSLASDIYMALPGYTYTETLPFYVSAINSLKEREVLVSENVMELRRLHIGDELTTNDKDDGTFVIAGTLPAIKGFESSHHGIVVMAHNPRMESYLISIKPRYVNFGVHFDNLGMIEVYGNILLKKHLQEKEGAEIVPRMIGLALSTALVNLAVNFLFLRDDYRMKRLRIVNGARKVNIFFYFLGQKCLRNVALPTFIALIFALRGLSYILPAISLVGLTAGIELVFSAAEAIAIARRK